MTEYQKESTRKRDSLPPDFINNSMTEVPKANSNNFILPKAKRKGWSLFILMADDSVSEDVQIVSPNVPTYDKNQNVGF
jgi:hypothetical protein